MKQPTPEEKEAAFAAFREELNEEVEQGIDDHESSMAKIGFLMLGVFIGVIALASLLP
jgi:type II secretory pathway component PulF